MEFNYAIAPYSTNPILQLNNHIGFDEDVIKEGGEIEKGDGQGINGKIFSREVFEIDSYNPLIITLYVNSMGGDVEEGFDILSAIAEAKSKTESIIVGFAYSTAGWIPLVSDVVKAYEYTTWMCHLPYNPDVECKKSSFLAHVANSIATIIAAKSGRNGKPKKTVAEVKEMMKSKTYYTAQQMYDEGLIDMVIPLGESEVQFEKISDVKNQYKEFKRVFNKFIPIKEKSTVMAYEKVLNKLSLTAGSDENEMLAAIARIENKATVLNQEKVDIAVERDAALNKLKASNDSQAELQRKLDEAENKVKEFDKLKNDYDAMDAENKALKETASNKEKAAADVETKLKAKNLVKEYIGKKIKADDTAAIEGWEKMAAENFDGTKLILEGLSTQMELPRPAGTEWKDGKTIDMGDGSDEAFRAANREKRKAK